MTVHELEVEKPVVAITGGSEGLGYALAQALLKSGFAVSICARSKSNLKTAVDALCAIGPIFAYQTDVSDYSSIKKWMSATLDRFHRLDALVHNASTIGYTPMPPLLETSPENMRQVYEVNVVAPVMLTQAALPALRKRNRGLIVTISSDAATGGYPNWGVYGASKAALDLVSKTLSAELTDAHIHVLAVDPGDMDTNLHRLAVPGETGLKTPVSSAEALLPLFLPLFTTTGFAYSNGSRLAVKHTGSSSALTVVTGGEQ
ncbi:SDR family NAD(P)-dependent oxidoreductase [Alicyclobacillus mengziensis]|uniref:SDR family oxidoreductase n=1 Tax=Alicyclobacillus mengziensis TaxID=2931921 RepID=A0A9X7Z5C5_9BACL|nr:SDR family oxidoreductase [Alicyclobacillus mengziensis]QSO46202.1 SDR family oxidoreductase [Alicyclobacillus mengziensis]